jgi:hypothetical protein
MSPVILPQKELAAFGAAWLANGGTFDKSSPNHTATKLGGLIDTAVASSLATMLGGVEILPGSRKKKTALYPPNPDCVETGHVTLVGGIRKQNYDVCYRPDGARVAFDSKTLNEETKSVGKNWQNMVNDLATEAATVHTRFPLAVVAFLVLIPEPAIGGALDPLSWSLDGLGGRETDRDPPHQAEAMCLALWDPKTGTISPTLPDPQTHPLVRIEKFAGRMRACESARSSVGIE